MFFLFRLAAAACNLLHVGHRTRRFWPCCQPPWTEMQQAASDTGDLSGTFILVPVERDGTWKGEMLRGKTKACPVSYPASNLWQHTRMSMFYT